jgi:beta-phosphoglucomutase-like phosphatase (HAD superfamily)
MIQAREKGKRHADGSRPKRASSRSTEPALLFDLDGTLVDSVYQHVLAWREALEQVDIELAIWRIHRLIGMSGGLLINALSREVGHQINAKEASRLARLHAAAYQRYATTVRALPGASICSLTLHGQE